MKVKILKDTVCGGERVREDQTVEASEDDALLLMRLGKAAPVDDEAKELMKKRKGTEALVEGGVEAAEKRKAEAEREAAKGGDKEPAKGEKAA